MLDLFTKIATQPRRASRLCLAGLLLLTGSTGFADEAVIPGGVTVTYTPCPTAAVGQTVVCGFATATGSGQLNNYTVTSNLILEAIAKPGTQLCVKGTVPGATGCTIGRVSFKATSAGTVSGALNVWTMTGFSPISYSLTGTNTTYAWEASGFGACTGGSGSWVVDAWFPATGCGRVEQQRSVACLINATSGVRTQTVVCRGSDGQVAADSFCSGTKPTGSESCTPSDQGVCGAEPITRQQVTLDTACAKRCIPDAAHEKYCLFLPL